MDNGQESLPVQSAPSSTFTQQLPLRVNPKYSLPTPLPPLQSMDQPPLSADVEGNSLGRTTSRRRKVSGRGQDQGNGVPRPVVPEAPRAPSAPYQSSYTNDGSPSNPKTNNMASFAVRARAAPSDLVPASFPRTDLDPIVQNTSQNIRSHRHGSINRPPGAVYSEIRGTERKALSSPRTYPTSPQYSSNPTVPRPSQSTESKSPQTSNTTEPTSSPRTFDAVAPKSDKSTEVLPSSRISNTGTAPRGVRITTSTSARSNARRASTGVTEPRAEWAADRSPLQKLEVKLNDISKEEKRARVEEAEQQLRESKLNGTRHERVDPTIHRGQSRRVSADASIKSRNDQSNQASGANKRLSSLGNQVVPVDSSADIQIKQSGGVSYKPSQKIPQFDRRPYPSATKADPPVSQAVDSCVAQTSRRSVSSPDSRYQSERGVRFQQPRFPSATNPGNDSETKTGLISASSRGSRDPSLRKSNIPQADGETHLTVQRNLGRELVNGESMNSKQALSLQQVPRSKKSELSGGHISLTPDIRAADSVAAQALDSKRDASEYRTTSQTAAGIDAHKKARFGNDKAEEPSTLSGSRLSDILHRRQQSESISDDRLRFKLGRLDEWRQGGTARLTSADFDPSSDIAPSQKAWWEVSKSKRGGDQSLDGRNDESYGKILPFFSIQDQGTESIPDSALSLKVDPSHVRPYVGNDRDIAAGLGSGSKLLNHKLFSNFRSGENPRLCLSSTYSYSCPLLAEHDPSHFDHICKPYMSKELTRSMRSVCVRIGPSPASFNPPLYLKCGPLLRYTGLKRDRLQDSRGPDAQPIGEREMWRGSVMIVTIDAESTYNPSPVLHLFPEPIDILPPPPQQADDESGHNLPPEYIDPVAGLPKLSRTGKTVYVKPVEDLEQEVDLSRVEDDGGLFEETRTAAVPTSYGQPNHRSKRNDITLAPPNTRHRLREASTKYQQVNGVRLHAERGVTFWRFNLEVELGEQQARIAYRINNCASVGFWVPARGQSMNIMFHSCNGFSMSVEYVSAAS